MSKTPPTTDVVERMPPPLGSAEIAPGVWLPPSPPIPRGVATGDRLAKTEPHIVDYVYDTLETLDRLLRQAEIPYSIAGGTLLGAIRQGGFIAWDDDGDIFMRKEDAGRFLALVGELIKLGFCVRPMYLGWKIRLSQRMQTMSIGAVDVLVVQTSADGQSLEYCSDKMREMFPNEAMPLALWNSVGDIQFGHLTLQGPTEELARPYLAQSYGPDWETVAESSPLDHSQRRLVAVQRAAINNYAYARRSGC